MKERSSSFFFWLCLKVVGDARFLGSVLYFFAARLSCMGEELDVWKCWDSSFDFLIPFALFKSSIGAARLLQIIA